MIEIELPCCGATTHLDELADTIRCESCGVALELDASTDEPIPLAA